MTKRIARYGANGTDASGQTALARGFTRGPDIGRDSAMLQRCRWRHATLSPLHRPACGSIADTWAVTGFRQPPRSVCGNVHGLTVRSQICGLHMNRHRIVDARAHAGLGQARPALHRAPPRARHRGDTHARIRRISTVAAHVCRQRRPHTTPPPARRRCVHSSRWRSFARRIAACTSSSRLFIPGTCET